MEHLEHTPWYHHETYIEAIRADADAAAGRRGDDEWISADEYYAGRGERGIESVGLSFEVVDLNEYRDAKTGHG